MADHEHKHKHKDKQQVSREDAHTRTQEARCPRSRA
jgi:hypothetical protein